jgi:hypothetical protein
MPRSVRVEFARAFYHVMARSNRGARYSAALIESFGGAQVISFAAQFSFRCRRSGALLAWTRFCPRNFLTLA